MDEDSINDEEEDLALDKDSEDSEVCQNDF